MYVLRRNCVRKGFVIRIASGTYDAIGSHNPSYPCRSSRAAPNLRARLSASIVTIHDIRFAATTSNTCRVFLAHTDLPVTEQAQTSSPTSSSCCHLGCTGQGSLTVCWYLVLSSSNAVGSIGPRPHPHLHPRLVEAVVGPPRLFVRQVLVPPYQQLLQPPPIRPPRRRVLHLLVPY